MDDSIGRIEWPPFLFHYIIVFVCAAFITSVCILKFKYLYWYSQPITFWFTIRRWFRGDDATGRWNNTVMNPLSLAERCNNAIVYPFLHFVRHDIVRVYGGGGGGLSPISDAPYERIAEFLSRRDTETPSASDTMYIPRDILEFILSQDTFGLSVFIGVLTGEGDNTTPAIKGDNTTPAIKGDNTPAIKGDNTPAIKGVCILTPRIMLSFGAAASSLPPRSVSIYMCEHLAWAKYITSERESLALLETTEYIQKSREIAGEQTLYRYHEIPGFVIPFTTVYTYTFAARTASAASAASLDGGYSIIPVSSANFAIFYAFVNERSRDFRCCILHELSILQSLVQSGIYRIYMLLLNQVRVMAAYIFAPSWMKVREGAAAVAGAYTRHKTKPKKTIGNRINALHNQISRTSTALVKYLPRVVPPKYDAFGKRVKRATRTGTGGDDGRDGDDGDDILRLISSIQQCDRDVFVRGFYAAAAALAVAVDTPRNATVICIDTLAHNYRIIDAIVTTASAAAAHWNLLSREKWYYILYNAIIHQETLCKDIAVI